MKKKKFFITSLAVGIIAFTAFSFRPPEGSSHKSNLKVLPKDISEQDLKNVMKDFSRSLGLGCSDCHAKAADDPQKLDFSSYELPNKQIALEMMKMTMRINKKEFGIKGKFVDNFNNNLYKVTCNTCHNGSTTPALKAFNPHEKK